MNEAKQDLILYVPYANISTDSVDIHVDHIKGKLEQFNRCIKKAAQHGETDRGVRWMELASAVLEHTRNDVSIMGEMLFEPLLMRDVRQRLERMYGKEMADNFSDRQIQQSLSRLAALGLLDPDLIPNTNNVDPRATGGYL
jgi:hypothetical protein